MDGKTAVLSSILSPHIPQNCNLRKFVHLLLKVLRKAYTRNSSAGRRIGCMLRQHPFITSAALCATGERHLRRNSVKDCKYCIYKGINRIISEEYGEQNLIYCALGEGKSNHTPEGCQYFKNDANQRCCAICYWYAGFEGVCCCPDSEWTANFRDGDYACDCWEEKTDGESN